MHAQGNEIKSIEDLTDLCLVARATIIALHTLREERCVPLHSIHDRELVTLSVLTHAQCAAKIKAEQIFLSHVLCIAHPRTVNV